jgi:hypothetical protein
MAKMTTATAAATYATDAEIDGLVTITVVLGSEFYDFDPDATEAEITAAPGSDDWDYALVCS